MSQRSYLLFAALCFLSPLRGAAQEAKIQLKGSVSPLVRQARPLARRNAAESVRFSFALPLRDQAGLDALLQSLYTPGDPLFHHYLSSAEFTARFGPTQADYDAVIAYAKQQGFTIAATYTNRALLDVTAPAQSVEKALSVRLMNYQAADKRLFRAPDAEPTLPASIAQRISGLIGLDEANPPHPLNVPAPFAAPKKGQPAPKALPASTGSFSNGGLTPSDIKTAYNLNGVGKMGAGKFWACWNLTVIKPAT